MIYEIDAIQQKKEEEELIRAYRCLNSGGRSILMNQARFLAHSSSARLYIQKQVSEPSYDGRNKREGAVNDGQKGTFPDKYKIVGGKDTMTWQKDEKKVEELTMMVKELTIEEKEQMPDFMTQ